ncbi:MAG TPA: hypothetical protein VFG51_01905 [Candidatus Saccharimonadia bacterium]|nr:hypothetical protein [Candidatus Saccharimonadia bacterium]
MKTVMTSLKNVPVIDRYRWLVRALVVLVVLLALVAGLFQEELRLEHLKYLYLQKQVQNSVQMR